MKSKVTQIILVSLALAVPASALAVESEKNVAPAAATEGKLPDNSAVNKNNNGAPTQTHSTNVSADQQANAKSDLEILQKIRRSITSEKNLSTYAENIKILSERGEVILKGPVRTAEEKALIEKKAAQIAGKEHVKSELQIVPR